MKHSRFAGPAAGLVLVVCLAAIGPRARAEEEGGKPPPAKSLEKQVEDLRRQMEEMRRLHEAETQKLREELEKIRAGQGEKEGAGGLESEIDRLLREADQAASGAGEKGPEETTFINRGLGLQALNPEISIAGDTYAAWHSREDEPSNTDFTFRTLDMHVQSYLDPYTKLKAAIEFEEGGAGLGEAYFTRFAVLPGLNFTAGKFRQQLGVVNRWHKHALDQVDFPLALRQIFGPEGLNQTGFSFDWTVPEFLGGNQNTILQVTGSTSNRVFAEASRSLPCLLLHTKNFRDLSKDLWVEVGATALLGWNDRFTVDDHTVRQRLPVTVLGADLTLRWEPTERMRYANLEWRTEFYLLQKDLLAPDGSGRDHIAAWGGYTSVQRKLTRTLDAGIRLDFYKPDSKDYAPAGDLMPLAYDGHHPYQWEICPYLTWWQSPFVRVRLECDYLGTRNAGPGDLAFFIQFVFAAGPHKHERY